MLAVTFASWEEGELLVLFEVLHLADWSLAAEMTWECVKAYSRLTWNQKFYMQLFYLRWKLNRFKRKVSRSKIRVRHISGSAHPASVLLRASWIAMSSSYHGGLNILMCARVTVLISPVGVTRTCVPLLTFQTKFTYCVFWWIAAYIQKFG